MTSRQFELGDPMSMKALAHPLRVELLTLLRERGPLTGTQLAKITGDSTASVSYHLSVLARHSFIEPDASASTRHKFWRASFDSIRIVTPVSSSDDGSAHAALISTLLESSRQSQNRFLERRGAHSPEWQLAATFQMAGLLLTPQELVHLGDAVRQLLRNADLHEGTTGPLGARRVSVSFIAVPAEES